MIGITKETFQEADEKTKLDILFDFQVTTSKGINDILKLLQQHPSDCEDRFKRLENRKFRDSLVSSGFGLVGGFAAMAAKLKFWG